MIRQKIINLIEKVTGEKNVHLEVPENFSHGDYFTNIALRLKKDPQEIVEKIFSVQKEKMRFFDKIEVAGPGFINFFLSRIYLQKQIGYILKMGRKFGSLKKGEGKKVNVEFISANPTGPLTVGNARGGPFGEALANILKKAGFNVEKSYYINDYGKQILALGHSVLKDNLAEYKGKYIDYLNKRINVKDPYRVGQMASKIIIQEMIRKTVKKMGIKFDEWFWESSLHQKSEVDKVIDFLRKKKLIYEKEKALWFKSSSFGDQRDRVMVKKNGEKTYLAGDIAYHRYKFERKKFDKAINIWGADHSGDVAGLKAGVEALGHQGKLDTILLQFVTVKKKGKRIRMSKRKGVYVLMDDLLDEVGVDAVKFFFLQKSVNTHLNFDLDLAKDQSKKNPVYYVQYAYARICSILRKKRIQKEKIKKIKRNLELLNHPSELFLIKQLVKFPEIIEDIAKDYQVQRLPQYNLDLADSFHKFYESCQVISEDKNLTQARLALVLATKIVFENALSLIGISLPSKM